MTHSESLVRWLNASMPDIQSGVASKSVLDLACAIAGQMVQAGTVTPEGIAMLKKHDPAKLQLNLESMAG